MIRRKIFKKNFINAATSIVAAAAIIVSGFFAPARAEGETDEAPTEALPAYGTVSLLDNGPEINAAAAIVMDINSGTILYSKNETAAYQPSSLTKLTTAYVCFDMLNMGDLVTCSTTAATQDFPTAANVGYNSGDTYSTYDALYGMLMASAEDSTYSLCEQVSGTMTDFASLMNTYANELGAINSNFVNGMGKQQDGHYSCCYDMALIASALMRNYPVYKEITSTKAATLSGAHIVSSSHRFVYGTDTCDYAYAGKTGGTAYGGDGTWSLCTYASYKGINAVCIIMGSPSNDKSYKDTKTLFSYVFENYTSINIKTLLESKYTDIGTLFSNNLLFNKGSQDVITYQENATICLPINANYSNVAHTITVEQITEFDYGENLIGKFNFYYNNRWAGSAGIYYYTEDASMKADEFNKYFPNFLINPDYLNESDLFAPEPKDDTLPKATLINRTKAYFLSLYTPAKSFSAVVAFVVFIIGTLLIMIIFPIKTAPKKTKYTKVFSDESYVLPDDSVSEAKRNRRRGSGDMTEMK